MKTTCFLHFRQLTATTFYTGARTPRRPASYAPQWRSQGEKWEASPRNPGKDGEQPRPQPAIRIDNSRKL